MEGVILVWVMEMREYQLARSHGGQGSMRLGVEGELGRGSR